MIHLYRGVVYRGKAIELRFSMNLYSLKFEIEKAGGHKRTPTTAMGATGNLA